MIGKIYAYSKEKKIPINTLFFLLCTQKTVSLNQRDISLIFSQRKNFFELKKVLLIQ